MSIFALVMLMLLPGLSPAGVWEEYIYLDRGVAIQFPAKPEASTVPYASALVKRSEEHTSELQSQSNLVCRLLLEKKKKSTNHLTRPEEIPRLSHTHAPQPDPYS